MAASIQKKRRHPSDEGPLSGRAQRLEFDGHGLEQPRHGAGGERRQVVFRQRQHAQLLVQEVL